MKPKPPILVGWKRTREGCRRKAGDYVLVVYDRMTYEPKPYAWQVGRGIDLLSGGQARTLRAACKAAERWAERRAMAVLRGLGHDERERESAVAACAQGLRLHALMIEQCTDPRQPWYRLPNVRPAIVTELRACADAVAGPEDATP